MSRVPKQAGPVGLAVAACAACCAGPVVAALGGIGTILALGMILVGAVAAGSILLALVALVAWKRRHRVTHHPSPPEDVPVMLSQRR